MTVVPKALFALAMFSIWFLPVITVLSPSRAFVRNITVLALVVVLSLETLTFPGQSLGQFLVVTIM